jgi:hypothetical protein
VGVSIWEGIMKLITIQNRDRLYEYIQAHNLTYIGTKQEIELAGINSKKFNVEYYIDPNGEQYKRKVVPQEIIFAKGNRYGVEANVEAFQLNLTFLLKGVARKVESTERELLVKKTQHPQNRVKMFIEKKVEGEYEQKIAFRDSIVKATADCVDAFLAEKPEINGEELIISVLEIPQMETDPTNATLQLALLAKLNDMANANADEGSDENLLV